MITEEDKEIFDFLKYELNTYHEIINIIVIVLIILTVINIITFYVSMIKTSIKEKQSIYKYTIPIVNWWNYFKLCDLPGWLCLIPVVNIIAHLVSPIKLAYEYRCKPEIGILGIFFPYIIFPMIAFSDKKSRRDLGKEDNTIHSIDQIDAIEEKMESDNMNDYDNFDIKKYNIKKEELKKTKAAEMIDKIEENALKDNYEDITYGADLDKKTNVKKEIQEEIVDEDYDLVLANETLEAEKPVEHEIVEIGDEEVDLKVGMKQKEKDIEEKSKLNIDDNADYKDYEFLKKDNSTIAFGGQKEVTKKAKNVTEEKYGRNRCSRCNTAIDETMTICPGCGANLKQ